MTFSLTSISLSVVSIIWIIAGIGLVAVLILLQRSLHIFSRGTVAFMAVVVLATAAIALLEKGNSTRNAERRTTRLGERKVALIGLDLWCKRAFDTHGRVTTGTVSRTGECLEGWEDLATNLNKQVREHYAGNSHLTSIVSEPVAIHLDKYGDGSWNPFSPRTTRWHFRVLIGAQVDGTRVTPDLVIRGNMSTQALPNSSSDWVICDLSARIARQGAPDTAKLFADAEFQNTHYGVKKTLTSNNRYGRHKVKYAWKE